MSHARLRRVGTLTAAVTVAGMVAAPVSAAPETAEPTDVVTTAALGANWYGSAPYVMPLANDPPDITEVMDATGQRAFLLAFILADGGRCAPAWDGRHPVSSDTAVLDVVNEIRAGGGDVIVAAGGVAGTKLGQVCSSPEATAAAYQQVIDRYDLHAFDFDIEVPEIEQHGAVANELGAAKILRENNPGLYVSVTIPTLTTGANWHGEQLLLAARGIGLVPNAFTIMPFDGGFTGAQAQIGALEGFHDQLMEVSAGTAQPRTRARASRR